MVRKELLKALRRIQITTNRLATQQLSGNYASVFKGQGLSFREVREYQPGDDVRAIDWNVSARMDQTFVKVFVEEREMTVMLVVDLSASQRFGTQGGSKVRLATEVAALCAFSAIKHNDRVGLIMATDQVEKIVPPMKGQKHVMRVIREIMGANPERTGTDLVVALETLMHVARRRSVAFLISDFYAPDYGRALSLAAARHDIIPIMLTDPRDIELPNVGLASFEDFETGESVIVDTGSADVRAHYAKQMRRQQAETVQLFNKLALDHCVVRTDQPYITPLRDLFARRARRIPQVKRPFALLLFAATAQAQTPTPSGSLAAPSASVAPAASASTSAAPAPSSSPPTNPLGCVERLPAGKERPKFTEGFPARGLSGHALPLVVTVVHGPAETVLPTGFHFQADAPEAKALKDAGFIVPNPEGGAGPKVVRTEGATTKSTVTLSFVALPKQPGRHELTLPAFPISIARASGELVSLCTQPHTIVIEDPTSSTPNPKPKDNPPPRRQREEWTFLKQAVSIGAIALVVGAILAWLIGRWLKRPRPVPPPPPPRPPWEVALESLHDLRHAGLTREGRFAEHFDRVSDVVRRYLGDRYGFDGLESTTREMLSELRATTPRIIVLDDIERFLRQADLVKFARLTPTELECSTALGEAEQIVERTVPPPMPVGAAAPEAPAADVRTDPGSDEERQDG